MSAITLDGRDLAARLRVELAREAAAFATRRGRAAQLALALVGSDATARLYAEQVRRASERVGLALTLQEYPAATDETALRAEVAALGARGDVDGVALLLPLPRHIRQRVVMEALPAAKDVDGLGPQNAGRLMLGFPSFVPSTADAALELLRLAGVRLQGLDTVVVGRSNVGGKPAGLLFLRENATVTFCHTRTPDLAAVTRQADVLFTSAGRPGAITAEMLKPGAIVLDAGMTNVDGQVVGDVDFARVSEVVGYITPAPGGLGPLTPLMLIRHTLIGPS
ncbi:MAG: bifunctional 5,10-methylenetetrahydrofolate dehydrogenase/5,10-methenyltetrahydrofolate cyclohydrolase [Chloroflexota bacterium]|nr:bifunctional 5,10-methylenetetrahydrofolate dehydrogenase/5,10-methenyltetrahydrofolate cyclohydrolase [Chloroflexota bacterium]